MGRLLQDTRLNKNTINSYRPHWMHVDTKNQLEQERLKAMQQLTGGIAHHLNNALQTMMGAAELAKQRDNIPDSVKQDIDLINKEGQKTAHLIRQLIEFSHQAIADTTLIDLAFVVKQFVYVEACTWPENIRITLNIEEEHKPFVIKANLKQLQHLLANLAENAKDAMPLGGELKFNLSRLSPSKQIFYPGTKCKDWMVLTISDTGTGIPSGEMPYIFEPFFTTKEIGSGNGLGLAQVYGIVKQLGGDINVSSKPGKETAFTLYLPTHALPEQG